MVDIRICKRCGIEKRLKSFKKKKGYPEDRLPTCRKCYDTNKLKEVKRTKDQIISQREKLLGRKYSLEHRLAISAGQKRVVVEGRHKWKVKEERHKDQDRNCLAYRMWKEQVILLKGKKCGICEKTERLQCHHIKCFYKFPELRLAPENGELLCIGCHMRHHNTKATKK